MMYIATHINYGAESTDGIKTIYQNWAQYFEYQVLEIQSFGILSKKSRENLFIKSLFIEKFIYRKTSKYYNILYFSFSIVDVLLHDTSRIDCTNHAFSVRTKRYQCF